jgi:hypothetical protein
VVNSTADGTNSTAGTDGVCTPQTSTTTNTIDTTLKCRLRDALYAAYRYGSGEINFDTSVFTSTGSITDTVINLAQQMTISPNTTINGLTSGSGSKQSNLVAIDGGGAYRLSLLTPAQPPLSTT